MSRIFTLTESTPAMPKQRSDADEFVAACEKYLKAADVRNGFETAPNAALMQLRLTRDELAWIILGLDRRAENQTKLRSDALCEIRKVNGIE